MMKLMKEKVEAQTIIQWVMSSGNFVEQPMELPNPRWFARRMGCCDPSVYLVVYDDGAWEIHDYDRKVVTSGLGLTKLQRSGYV